MELKRLRPVKERKKPVIGGSGSKKQLLKVVNLSEQKNFQRLNADCSLLLKSMAEPTSWRLRLFPPFFQLWDHICKFIDEGSN
jgi:hypothetical protein